MAPEKTRNMLVAYAPHYHGRINSGRSANSAMRRLCAILYALKMRANRFKWALIRSDDCKNVVLVLHTFWFTPSLRPSDASKFLPNLPSPQCSLLSCVRAFWSLADDAMVWTARSVLLCCNPLPSACSCNRPANSVRALCGDALLRTASEHVTGKLLNPNHRTIAHSIYDYAFAAFHSL